jgi:monoamine oxidase
MKYDIIIAGAGAAGLMAAKELSEAGYTVCLLEAAATAGGRICTLKEDGFDMPVETGAEFIHGRLELTLKLLKQARIGYEPVRGQMIPVRKGKWHTEEVHDTHWNLFMQQLRYLEKDISIEQFLGHHFPGPAYESLRNSVQQFAEGYDLADISKASMLAIKKEWMHEDQKQYRVSGGYTMLVDYLLENCIKQNSVVHFSACVCKIEYSRDHVTVHTTGNRQFEASKIIISVSAGVLQSGDIEFVPVPAGHLQAIRQIGFGSVIKILLQFKTPFWKAQAAGIGFLLSDEAIPTWWTQLPVESNLLTGWLGGPKATAKKNATKAELLQLSITSLSNIFRLDIDFLENELLQHRISCWDNHPFVKGGYSYNTPGAVAAKRILSKPVQDVLFFAGEALYEGESQGTVESALQSGLAVANCIKKK